MASSMKNSDDRVVFYVTRDIERALGARPDASYRIITNDTSYSRSIQKLYPDFIHIISSPDGGLLDTWQLLEHSDAQTAIGSASDASILVFKNTSKIEGICNQKKWNLLNPSSSLAEKIENKASQIAYLGDLASYLPEHSLKACKDVIWEKKPIIIQWAHSHTGLGTILVNSESELKSIQSSFPERLARVTAYVHGPSFTLNVCVDDSKEGDAAIALGNISYQITGLPPFTENPFSTIGNDWSLTHSLLDESEIEAIQSMARAIGSKLKADGWKGLFGIDVMRDDEIGKIFLIEINARQPASTTYESQLQAANRDAGLQGQTIFEAHLGIGEGPIIPINDGAQIIQRMTRLTQSISPKQLDELSKIGCSTILYENEADNSDLARVQSSMGIMETHGRFNKRGKAIESILNER